MPIQIKYIHDGIGIEFIGSGVVTGAEIKEARQEIYRDEVLQKLRYQIVDRTDITEFDVSNEDIRSMAEKDKTIAKDHPDIVVAIVSASDLQYGISRMYQAHAGESAFVTEIFRDRESADKWIESQLKKGSSTVTDDL